MPAGAGRLRAPEPYAEAPAGGHPLSEPAPSSAPPILEVELEHAFPGGAFRLQVAFQSAHPTLALFGPSGSGKSTVLQAIAGLLHPDKGVVRVAGRALLDTTQGVDLPPRERGVGLVLQDGMLFPLLSVRQNLLFGAPKQGAQLTLEQVAGLLEIDHLLDRQPRNLSGGERQRIALGRAALSEPKLLLCDEPFAALDTPRRERLLPILAQIRELLDIPLILVSHGTDEVRALAADVVVLDEGRVGGQGAPDAVLGGRAAAPAAEPQ